MFGTLRRKRVVIFKTIIAIPVLWFSFIGFIVVISGGGIGIPEPQSHHNSPRFIHRNIEQNDVIADLDNNNNDNIDDDNTNLRQGEDDLAHVPFRQQPVIDKPNADRLRFEEAMQRDAADLLRRNEELHHNHPVMVVRDPDSGRNQLIEPEVKHAKTTTYDPNAPGIVAFDHIIVWTAVKSWIFDWN